jgi:hypothetical protein
LQDIYEFHFFPNTLASIVISTKNTEEATLSSRLLGKTIDAIVDLETLSIEIFDITRYEKANLYRGSDENFYPKTVLVMLCG